MATATVLVACSERRYDGKTEAEWVGMFREGSALDRTWAVGALAAMDARSEDARTALVSALNDSLPSVAVAAAKAMTHLEEAREHRERVLSLLWRVARGSTSDARISALEALGLEPYRDPRSVPLLAQALEDSSVSARATAAVSLGMLESLGRPALDALHRALSDTSSMVVHEVRDAIRAISGERLQH